MITRKSQILNRKSQMINHNSKMKRIKKSKMLGGKHIQHTKEFIYELNSVNANVPFTPFRISDETWLIGKYKNTKLKDLPTNYINWVIKNFTLSENALSILKKYINE